MSDYRIQRTQQDGYATFGDFFRPDGTRISRTCELPNADNPTGHRCIIAGRFLCRRRWSAKHGCEVFEITGVPGRTDIEIHPANWPFQLLGCVAPGESIEVINGKRGVTNSRATFDAFMREMQGINEFWLDVVDVPRDAAQAAAA